MNIKNITMTQSCGHDTTYTIHDCLICLISDINDHLTLIGL